MVETIKKWTLAELHSLPDDGNKYELLHGELFVTPPPTDDHETILARLTRVLDPYVAANRLGYVYHPRSVVRFEGSEVEPDLMVRAPKSQQGRDWDDAPTPILIVETLSPSTRRRDREQKKAFYIEEVGVAEYWIVDPERKTITVVRRGEKDRVVDDVLTWAPAGARSPLTIEAATIFG